MENHIQEIITRAIIGKGSKKTSQSYTLDLNHSVDEALGCWIINHQYTSFIEEDKVKVQGTYDLHIWYAHANKKESSVEVRTIRYLEEIDMNKSPNALFCANDETRCRCSQEPKCVSASIDQGKIVLKIEKTMNVSVIGETMIKIETKEDDLDFRIDPNFIK